MSSGFSENKVLWGLLSLAGSPNLPKIDLILYLPCTSIIIAHTESCYNQYNGLHYRETNRRR